MMAAKTKPKTGVERVTAYRQRQKDRHQLVRAFLDGAPENVAEKVNVGFHTVNGKPEIYVNLKDESAAAYMNAFSRKLGVNPRAVMREMAAFALAEIKGDNFEIEGQSDDH